MKFEIIRGDSKTKLVKQLIDSLDYLYDELTYENNDNEIVCIKSKIKVREETIKHLLK